MRGLSQSIPVQLGFHDRSDCARKKSSRQAKRALRDLLPPGSNQQSGPIPDVPLQDRPDGPAKSSEPWAVPAYFLRFHPGQHIDDLSTELGRPVPEMHDGLVASEGLFPLQIVKATASFIISVPKMMTSSGSAHSGSIRMDRPNALRT